MADERPDISAGQGCVADNSPEQPRDAHQKLLKSARIGFSMLVQWNFWTVGFASVAGNGSLLFATSSASMHVCSCSAADICGLTLSHRSSFSSMTTTMTTTTIGATTSATATATTTTALPLHRYCDDDSHCFYRQRCRAALTAPATTTTTDHAIIRF